MTHRFVKKPSLSRHAADLLLLSGMAGEVSNATRSNQKKIYDSEREVQQKLAESEKRIKEAQEAEQSHLEQMKDEYQKQYLSEEDRQIAMLQAEKARGYETLRNMKRDIQKEVGRTKRDGDKLLQETKDYYGDVALAEQQRAEETIKRSQQSAFAAQQGQLMSSGMQERILKDNHAKQIEILRAEQSDQLEKTQAETQKMYQTTRDTFDQATVDVQNQFTSKLDQQKKLTEALLGEQNKRAARQLHQLTESNSRQIDAFASRQSDPFYQMVSMNGRIREHANGFTFSAEIPEYEKDTISVSVRDGQLVVTGNRKAETKVDKAPGQSVKTSSYQSYSETYPLNYPVDPKLITKTYEDGTLTIEIPKRTSFEHPLHQAKNKDTSMPSQKPDFPKAIAAKEGQINPNEEIPDPVLEKSRRSLNV